MSLQFVRLHIFKHLNIKPIHIYIYILLFLLFFINDIPNIFINVNTINLNVYADDTSLTVYVNSDVELTRLLHTYKYIYIYISSM